MSQQQAIPTTGFAPVQGGRLYYEVLGEGHPLVLVHAGIADLRMWNEQFPIFARHFRTVRYDQRGYGKSESEGVSYSPRQDLLDLLDHLGIDRAHLIGVSMGGMLIVDFTLEHPERVTALVPVGAGLSGYQAQVGKDKKSQLELKQFTRMDELWDKKDMDGLLELELEMWVDGPMQARDRVAPEVRNLVGEMSRQASTHLAEGAKPEELNPPAYRRLGDIHVPTLVIVGDLDTTGILQRCEILAHDIPGAREVIIPGTAHMLNMEKPAEFNQIVLDFLNGMHLAT